MHGAKEVGGIRQRRELGGEDRCKGVVSEDMY